MKFGLNAVALLLSGIPLGHAAGLKAAVPPPEIGTLRGLQDNSTTVPQDNSTTVPANSTIPDSNGTVAEGGKGSGSGSGGKRSKDPKDACCVGKYALQSLQFLLTGGECPGTNTQKKDECSGYFPSYYYNVQVKLTEGAKFQEGGTLRNNVNLGDPFVIVPYGDKFSSKVKIQIRKCYGEGAEADADADARGCDVQYLDIHTSCSDKLILGESFGGVTLDDYNGGERIDKCAVCINDKPGGFQDTGCNEDCKICVGTEYWDLVPVPDGENGDVCKVCQDDKSGGGVDSGCGKDHPICVPEYYYDRAGEDTAAEDGEETASASSYYTGGFGSTCALCIHDSYGILDSGCPHDKPVCVTDGLFYRGYQYGFECAACVSSGIYGTKEEDSGRKLNGYTPDKGCTNAAPFCNGDYYGQPGTGCFQCKNDDYLRGADATSASEFNETAAADEEGTADEAEARGIILVQSDYGCNDYGSSYSQCVAAPGDYGTECATCVNDVGAGLLDSYYDAYPDSGCPSDYPACKAPYGEGGSKCAVCINDALGNQVDSGCGFLEYSDYYGGYYEKNICFDQHGEPDCDEAGSHCVYCANSEEGAKVDLGCEKGYPLCGKYKKPVDLNKEGQDCFKCQEVGAYLNDLLPGSGYPEVDTGCNHKYSLCKPTLPQFLYSSEPLGNECKKCFNLPGYDDPGCPPPTEWYSWKCWAWPWSYGDRCVPYYGSKEDGAVEGVDEAEEPTIEEILEAYANNATLIEELGIPVEELMAELEKLKAEAEAGDIDFEEVYKEAIKNAGDGNP